MNRKLHGLAALIAVAMALSACGGGNPDTITYRDADNRSLFELPKDWNLYPADELVQVGPVPFLPDIGGYRPVSFVAFDGAAGRSLDNLRVEVAASPHPIGAQIIRQISPEDRSLLSRQILALSAYDLVNAAQGVEMIQSEDFSFGRDYDGIRRLVGVTDDDGDLGGRRLYPGCYQPGGHGTLFHGRGLFAGLLPIVRSMKSSRRLTHGS